MLLRWWVGRAKDGKTTIKRDHWLPRALGRPSSVFPGFNPKLVLVHDPLSIDFPNGQYPGAAFESVGEFMRHPERRTRISRIVKRVSDPDDAVELAELMCEAALKMGHVLVDFDELGTAIPYDRKPGPSTRQLLNDGRKDGCYAIGTSKYWCQVHPFARNNVDVFSVGQLTDEKDVIAVAKALRLAPGQIDLLTSLPRDPKKGYERIERFPDGPRVEIARYVRKGSGLERVFVRRLR